MKLIGKNKQQVIALGVIALFFLISKNLFVDYTISSTDFFGDEKRTVGLDDENENALLLEQTDSSDKFEQLRTEREDVLLGQIIKANKDIVLSGVVFDIDVTKIDNRGGNKYRLVIKKAKKDQDNFEIKTGTVGSTEFEVNEIENFRRKDGKIRFPITAELKKDGYYFVGIDKEKIKTDKFNFLVLNGSKNDVYNEGTAAAKINSETVALKGDLYFQIIGDELTSKDE